MHASGAVRGMKCDYLIAGARAGFSGFRARAAAGPVVQ